MTTHTRALTQRIPLDTSVVGRLLCSSDWHDHGRWELTTAELKQGRSAVEVLVQIRECIRCGSFEIKRL